MPYETEKGQAQIAALWKEDPLVTPSGDWRAGLCEKALGSSALAAEMASSLLGCIRSRATRSRIHSSAQQEARNSRCKLEHSRFNPSTQMNILPVRAAAKRGQGAVSTLMGF